MNIYLPKILLRSKAVSTVCCFYSYCEAKKKQRMPQTSSVIVVWRMRRWRRVQLSPRTIFWRILRRDMTSSQSRYAPSRCLKFCPPDRQLFRPCSRRQLSKVTTSPACSRSDEVNNQHLFYIYMCQKQRFRSYICFRITAMVI